MAALAARDDVPFIDVTTSGDEIFAVARTEPGSRDPLVFRQLPSTQAVTSVQSSTILHVFRLTSAVASPGADRVRTCGAEPGWSRSSQATELPVSAGSYGIDTDALEQSFIDALTPDARLTAAALSAHTGHPGGRGSAAASPN